MCIRLGFSVGRHYRSFCSVVDWILLTRIWIMTLLYIWFFFCCGSFSWNDLNKKIIKKKEFSRMQLCSDFWFVFVDQKNAARESVSADEREDSEDTGTSHASMARYGWWFRSRLRMELGAPSGSSFDSILVVIPNRWFAT